MEPIRAIAKEQEEEAAEEEVLSPRSLQVI